MQIKFAICCKKIHKVGCGNSQSDGGKVNNYQPLKTISFYLFVHEFNELNENSFLFKTSQNGSKNLFKRRILSGKTDEASTFRGESERQERRI